MKGLANFLLNGKCLKLWGEHFFSRILDEAPVIKKEEEQDDIFRILNSNGVSYTHHNDTLLKPSAIEASMVNRAIQVISFDIYMDFWPIIISPQDQEATREGG